MEYRDSKSELNYYGSDLNKFVDENSNRFMTAMNIDMCLHKREGGVNCFKFVESKTFNRENWHSST